MEMGWLDSASPELELQPWSELQWRVALFESLQKRELSPLSEPVGLCVGEVVVSIAVLGAAVGGLQVGNAVVGEAELGASVAGVTEGEAVLAAAFGGLQVGNVVVGKAELGAATAGAAVIVEVGG